MEEEFKCSAQHLNEMKHVIDIYLTTKGITDHSKYDIIIKDNKPYYTRWEYPNIPQLENVNTVPLPVIEIKIEYSYILFENIRELKIGTYYNARGFKKDGGTQDTNRAFIEEITKTEMQIKNRTWKDVYLQPVNEIQQLFKLDKNKYSICCTLSWKL